MKYSHLFSLSFLILILVACDSDVDDEVKIDGHWKLESVSGGISGGGFPVDGDVSIVVSGSDLDMFKDDELIMEADISYSIDEVNRVILKLDRSYINEQPEFLLGGGALVASKSDDSNMLSLWELLGSDGYSYDFVK